MQITGEGVCVFSGTFGAVKFLRQVWTITSAFPPVFSASAFAVGATTVDAEPIRWVIYFR